MKSKQRTLSRKSTLIRFVCFVCFVSLSYFVLFLQGEVDEGRWVCDIVWDTADAEGAGTRARRLVLDENDTDVAWQGRTVRRERDVLCAMRNSIDCVIAVMVSVDLLVFELIVVLFCFVLWLCCVLFLFVVLFLYCFLLYYTLLCGFVLYCIFVLCCVVLCCFVFVLSSLSFSLFLSQVRAGEGGAAGGLFARASNPLERLSADAWYSVQPARRG
jgi:hypothetical protein